ncbi:ABC transporter substrate-binding protein [Litoreibacter albidus]|uniref:Peptide/nickel transport system substrate-binding protein n=1 Tax=Litoreibacter albidus TaxID=670155 RepID=A0A1H3CRW4_9RHOB|nr:ABC transporter substrate-binding protein [Litoreibacter albidus]SDX56648.1 peptide/nickel transport system substrate-binding protein [Litoreibacter albidus]
MPNIRLSSVFLASALALSPAASGAETLRFASQGDIGSMDPYVVEEVFTSGFLGNIYEGLVRRAPDLSIQPALAESWELLSPTHWRFHLRKDVTFHDGTPFNADDVIYSADRVRAGASDFKNRLPSDAKVVAVDDYTVDFITTEPNPILHYTWANWYIMNRDWAEANGVGDADKAASEESYATLHENGTGPFQLVSRAPGVKTTLSRYDGWWGEGSVPTNVTEVEYTPVPNAATRVAALLSGQLDVVFPVPVQDIARVEAAPSGKIEAGPEVRTMYLTMNQWRDTLPGSGLEGKNPLKDRRVREAMYRAIDLETIHARILRGRATPAALMVAPGVNGYSDSFKRYEYDPDRSKELLAEAGYPDGFTFTFQCSNNMYVNDEAICLAVSNMLAKVGIDAKANVQAKAQYLEAILSPNMDFGLAMLGTTPASLDSHIALYSLHMCPRADENSAVWAPDDLAKIVAGKSNFAGYCNPEIDRLANEILIETDEDKRNALINEAWTITTDDVAYIPLHQSWGAWGVREGVGVEVRADNIFDWRYVTVAE